MRIRTGTSGFSFPEWKGSFYPADIAEAEMLRWYAERLETVEINNTFYRMPNAKVLEGWAEKVPPQFRFVLKASRRITHIARLKETAAESVEYFFRTAAVLGERVGATLFQLPPNFKKDVPRLAAFLGALPRNARAAFEFRHPSWFADDTYDALRTAGAALCVAEDEDLKTPMVATADWGYLRLRRQDYGDDSLRETARELLAQPWSEAFVFFKHEEEGKGPVLAARFRDLLPEGSR